MPRRRDPDCIVPWPADDTKTGVLLDLLGKGKLALDGLMPWSSNYTFLGTVSDASGDSLRISSEPMRGERPLWDFPLGYLAKREVAA